MMKVARSIPAEASLSYTMQALRGTAHWGGGATSQLDVPSLTPLSVAGSGRLQLGVPHWDTSVDYCK